MMSTPSRILTLPIYTLYAPLQHGSQKIEKLPDIGKQQLDGKIAPRCNIQQSTLKITLSMPSYFTNY